MRRTILRRTVVVPLVLLLSLLGPGGASASPLASATAYAYGISLSVADNEIVAPTPEQNAGPGPGTGSDDLVQVPLGSVAFAGTIGAKAQTTLESTIDSELGDQYLNVVSGGPGLPSTYNAQSYARTEGLALLAGQALPPEVASTINLLGTDAVVAADLVHSEALVSCTDGNATVVGGGQVAGLVLLGQDLSDTVDGTANQVIDLAGTVLETLNATLIVNEVITSEGGVAVNALRLTIPGLTELIVAHTEVTDSTCEPVDLPECSDRVDNDGDGKIDFPADPGCADALDDDERDLIRTGGNGPGLGLAVFGAGGLLMLAAVRMRKTLFASKS